MKFSVKVTIYPKETVHVIVTAKDANSALIAVINNMTDMGYSVRSLKFS